MDERDECRGVIKNLKHGAKDMSEKLAAMSEELKSEKEELQAAHSNAETLKLELQKRNNVMSEEADRLTVLERQLETKTHHCNDLEREISHMKRKMEEQVWSRKVAVTQTSPDSDVSKQDDRIVGVQDKLVAAERRIRDALEQLSRTAKERDSLRGQLNDVADNSSAMQQVLDSNTAVISRLELDLKKSSEKICRLEKAVSEKEKRVNEMEEAANEAESTIGSLTAENAVLEQRIKQLSGDDKFDSSALSMQQKNSELTAQVLTLKEDLEAKQENYREALQQKDEEIARLQLKPEVECWLSQQRHKNEKEPENTEGNVVKQESSVADTAENVSLDRLKKQHAAELRDAESRRSEIDCLKCKLQTLEGSHREEVTKLEGRIADLTSKLSTAETEKKKRKQKKVSSGGQTPAVQASEGRSTESSHNLLQMETPVENEQTRVCASTPSSAAAAGMPDAQQQTTDEMQQLIASSQSRICELEKQLEEANSRKHDGEMVRMLIGSQSVAIVTGDVKFVIPVNPLMYMT